MEEFLYWIWNLNFWTFIIILGIFVFISALGQSINQNHNVNLTIKNTDSEKTPGGDLITKLDEAIAAKLKE